MHQVLQVPQLAVPALLQSIFIFYIFGRYPNLYKPAYLFIYS